MKTLTVSICENFTFDKKLIDRIFRHEWKICSPWKTAISRYRFLCNKKSMLYPSLCCRPKKRAEASGFIDHRHFHVWDSYSQPKQVSFFTFFNFFKQNLILFDVLWLILFQPYRPVPEFRQCEQPRCTQTYDCSTVGVGRPWQQERPQFSWKTAVNISLISIFRILSILF